MSIFEEMGPDLRFLACITFVVFVFAKGMLSQDSTGFPNIFNNFSVMGSFQENATELLQQSPRYLITNTTNTNNTIKIKRKYRVACSDVNSTTIEGAEEEDEEPLDGLTFFSEIEGLYGFVSNIREEMMVSTCYNKLQMPIRITGLKSSKKFPIRINIYLEKIDVKELEEQIKVNLFFEMYWRDRRLTKMIEECQNDSYTILPPSLLEKIWTPDIQFRNINGGEEKSLISNMSSLRLYPDPKGLLRYSTRVTIVQDCPMDFSYYPADTQICSIRLHSLTYEVNLLELKWMLKPEVLPCKISTDIAGPNYITNIKFVDPQNESSTIYSTAGVYSSIKVIVTLKRQMSYHLLQTYLPSLIFVFVSWLGFLIPANHATERMAFSISCLFTMTAMFSSVRESTPTVCYIKALDIWMITCVVFLFLNLVEQSLIGRVGRRELKNPDSLSLGLSREHSISDSSLTNDTIKKCKSIFKTTDKLLSSCIPAFFLIFFIVYWIWLFSGSNYLHPKDNYCHYTDQNSNIHSNETDYDTITIK